MRLVLRLALLTCLTISSLGLLQSARADDVPVYICHVREPDVQSSYCDGWIPQDGDSIYVHVVVGVRLILDRHSRADGQQCITEGQYDDFSDPVWLCVYTRPGDPIYDDDNGILGHLFIQNPGGETYLMSNPVSGLEGDAPDLQRHPDYECVYWGDGFYQAKSYYCSAPRTR